ncbi:MAG: histidine phosphatase family protein [Pseudomonadota bacterium]
MKAALALVALLMTAMPAMASDVLSRLGEPGVHAVMRHALAPGSHDPDNFDISKCETQRNLSDDGRRQARRAGDLIRAAGVTIDVVWSSRWCRVHETADLMALGEVENKGFLRSFSGAAYKGTGRTRELREALMALPAGQTALVVTHNVNVQALTGVRPLSGEIQVVQISPSGEVTLLGQVEVPIF